MTKWHAVVPIKPVPERKTRLQECLTSRDIEALTERMLRHVLDVAARVEAIGAIAVLAKQRPCGWHGHWIADPGAGLNAALVAAALVVPDRLVIVHADLPALQPDDLTALLAAAESGAALAPDRRGTGTNAIALRDASNFAFAFGSDSFARHCAVLPGCGVVRRAGLGLDIDLPDDLALAVSLRHL